MNHHSPGRPVSTTLPKNIKHSPIRPLSYAPDLGVGLEAEPGRDGPVLLGLLGQLLLDGERLLRRLQKENTLRC